MRKLVKKSSFPNIKKIGWTNLNLIGFFNVPSIVMHLLAIKRKDVRILIFIGLWMKGFSCERREHYWLMSTDLWHTSPNLVQLAIGVYAINVNLFKMCQLPTTFSWHFSPQNLKDVFFFMLNCTKWPPADENNLNDLYKEWEKRCIYTIRGPLTLGAPAITGS